MENTDTVPSLDLLHDDVQQDECPRTTHPSTAVDQQWLLVGDGVQFTDVTDEGNERHDVVWHSVIRPGRVVEMSHCHVLRVCLRQLHIRERVATNRVGHQCKMRGFVQTDIFKFEFPELILCKWHVGREGHTEFVLHSERVM